MTIEGTGEELVLESEVPGQHSRGGWAQMAQSHYQRHIQDHRARHFEAVIEGLIELIEHHGVERVVLAGEAKNVALFRESLPPGSRSSSPGRWQVRGTRQALQS